MRAAWAVVPVLLKVVTSDEGAASVQSCCASGFVWSSLVDEAQPSSVKNRADMAERLPTEGSRKVTPARVAPDDDRRAFWRSVAVSVLRVSVTIAVLGAVYALAPLGRRVDGSVVAELSLSVARALHSISRAETARFSEQTGAAMPRAPTFCRG